MMQQTKAQWATHVRQWRASGETLTVYSHRHGLKMGQLRYWSAQLSKAEASEASSGKSMGFASVQRKGGKAGTAKLLVHVGGAQVEVVEGFDEAMLSQVVRALSSSSVKR